jgi:DNA-binding NarL/FixJ family response regulator
VTVLVVDNDAASREVMAAYLEQYGVTVLTAASAQEAFDFVQREHLDALLVDTSVRSLTRSNSDSKVRSGYIKPETPRTTRPCRPRDRSVRVGNGGPGGIRLLDNGRARASADVMRRQAAHEILVAHHT